MHYIGMDCHITTLDFAVVNDTDRLIKANATLRQSRDRDILMRVNLLDTLSSTDV